ncbi:kelch protein, putative [Plasmodium ovale wallikeri]|uniref:Kelch protein, putative n=1 Tax=Plasmodium ovale wallikeri TaxID=864142 RepID=A0A1A8YIQ4_PLAOA|nr:kelch protein, putative [Plasmodium ovale wallikeri]
MNVLSRDHPDDALQRADYLNDGGIVHSIDDNGGIINNNNVFNTISYSTDNKSCENSNLYNINRMHIRNKVDNLCDTKSVNKSTHQTCYKEINKLHINKDNTEELNGQLSANVNIDDCADCKDEINIVYSYVINDLKKEINSHNEFISMRISIDGENYILKKKVTKLPFLRHDHFLCLTKTGCILAIGGTDGKKKYALVEKYCVDKKKWKQINLMHFSRSSFCGICTEDNNLYVLGGEGNQHILKSVEYYDSRINSWISLPPLNYVRHSASAIIFQNMLFIIGGKDGIGNYGRVHKSVEMLNLNEKNMKWTMRKPLKQARLGLATIVFKDKIYAIGKTRKKFYTYFFILFVYHSSTILQLFKKSFMPNLFFFFMYIFHYRCLFPVLTFQYKHESCPFFFFFFFFWQGGSTGVKELSSVEIYDFKTDEWQEGPNLNYPRSNFVVFLWKNHLVAYGGISQNKGVTTLST